MSGDYFEYPLEIDSRITFLQCKADYDYSTDCGPIVTVLSVELEGWEIIGLLDDAVRDDLADYAVDYWGEPKKFEELHMKVRDRQYALEQELTHNSLLRDGEVK